MEIQQQNRFKDAPWFPQGDETLMIGGAGGIGSWLSLFLVRAGFLPFVWDYDKLETHNLGGQLYRKEDVGKFKVQALNELIKTFTGVEINAVNDRVTQETSSHHFCFSAFDNMQARKDLFEVWKKSIPNSTVQPLFIDGRLEMEQIQIFCVTPDLIDDYERNLFDDSRVEDAPCTMRQTSHTAAIIAGLMTSFFTNHMTNIYEREKVRYLPFFYEIFVPLVQVNEQAYA